MPKAPAVIRAKLVSPEAAGMRSGDRPDSVMVTSGMKKNAIAMPWITVGIMSVVKSACVLKRDRIHSTSANTRKANVAKRRGSTRVMVLPTIGDRMMANRPTGARIMPASVAV